MEKTPGTMMKEFVNSQKFESTADVMAAMKEMFGEVLQQVMECELEEKLGYEKSERVSETGEEAMSKNYRNGDPLRRAWEKCAAGTFHSPLRKRQ